MDVDTLRSFIAFVDTGSFTRAARQTFRTQSAISMQMKKLEAEVGIALFRKEGRNLVLTQEGQQLVSYARRMLNLHDEVLADFSSRQPQQPLRIGCPDDYAESILPDMIELIRGHVPDMTYRIVCDSSTQLRAKTDAGELDVAILTRSPEAEEGYLIKHDSGVWVTGNEYSVSEKQTLNLVLYEPDCKFHSTAIDALEKQGIDYRVLCSTSSATAIKALLRQHIAISAMALSSVASDLTVIRDPRLPSLPSVDIVMTVSSLPHPLFGAHVAAKICREYATFTTPDNH